MGRKFLSLFVLIIISQMVSYLILSAHPSGPATLNAADFRKTGSPTAGIQEAVDALPEGGGIVFIPAGTWEITRAIHLRSGVQLKGEGELTVIARRDPCFQVPLAASADSGALKITVKDVSGFKAGTEICVRSHKSSGWWCTHPVIESIEGQVINLDRALTHRYLLEDEAHASNFFPAFYANESKEIRIEDLVIDGRMEKREGFGNEFTVSAIHFRDVKDALICRVHVKRYPGDGFSMQIGDNITVADCLSEYNLGHGFHPGTGITSGSWTNNVGRYNGWDGLYFCHRVRHTLVSGNRFHDNGWNGMGGLGEGGEGGDRYDVVSGNFCYNNGKCGIQCTGGGNNIVVNNVCENNSRSEPLRWPGILVEDTFSSIISGNKCLDFQVPDSAKTQGYGILVTGTSRDNIIKDNILTGHPRGGISGEALTNNKVEGNIYSGNHEPAGM
ncbi:MAG TPA: right-handed parallel beta-helix repeat-containing protein [archaeon]|nr:right-handed parallel beta-helix repeat-containing protein [archaeon]